MSNRKIGWAFSAERPVAVQSPSMLPLSDIQAKLNFSAVKSPSSVTKKRPLMNSNSSSSTSLRNMNSRIADYHMSKQNPDVLDRMYSTSLPASPQNGLSPFHSQHTLTPPHLHNRPSSSVTSPVLPFQNRISHSPYQMSLLRQTLKASKGQSAAKSSLVQLAAQRGSIRLNGSPVISPVVVRLSRGSHTPPSVGARGDQTRVGNGSGHTEQEKVENPCDKDVVLSALRSKRKRWATTAVDQSHSPLSGGPVSDQPSAKRLKHGTSSLATPTHAVGPSTDRKRTHDTPQSSNTSKRSKIIKPTPHKANRIRVPDIEYESDTEHAQSDVAMVTDTPVNREVSDKAGDSSAEVKKKSPIVVDEEVVKKRVDSLTVLKTVFPSTQSEKSLRREVPVFCATGQKPHMPSQLSSNRTATKEDLMKDRAAAAERLKEFLVAGDSGTPPAPFTITTTTHTLTSSTLPSVATATPLAGVKLNQGKSLDQPAGTQSTTSSVSHSGGMPVTALSSVDLLKTGLKPSTALSTKTVSFANPPASGLPTTTTVISSQPTTAVTSSLLTGFNLPQGGLQSLSGMATASPASIATTAPAVSATGGGGGLSLPSVTSGAPTTTAPLTTQPAVAPTVGIQFAVPSQPLQTAQPAGSLKLITTQPGVTSTQSSTQVAGSSLMAGGPQLIVSSGSVAALNLSSTQSLAQSGVRVPSPLQVSQKPPPAVSQGLSLVTTIGTSPLTQTLNNAQQPSLGLKPTLSFSLQQQGGKLSFGNLASGSSSQNQQQSSGGLQLGKTTAATTQQSSGGLQLGKTTATTTQQSSGGLLFGKSMTAAPTQQSSGGPLFGKSATAATTQQSGGGLLFGNGTTAATTQQLSGGLLFGNNTTTAATQQSSVGLLFGQNVSNGSSTNQQASGFSFGNKTTTSSSGFSFTASISKPPQQTSLFNNQAAQEGTKSVGLLFGNTASQPTATTASGTFSFTGTQQQGMFSTGGNPQQPASLKFGGNTAQTNPQSSSGFGGGMNLSAQNAETKSIFRGVSNQSSGPGFNFSATLAQSQQKTNTGTGFGFTAGGNNQLQVNFGQTSQPGLNFGMGQSQNGNGNNMFKAGANGGQTGANSSGFSFGGNGGSTGQVQGGLTGGNLFNSPQPGLHPPANTGGGFPFTPQPTPPQQGFNFSSTAPNQSGFNIGLTTPTPNPFSAGTPGESTPRSTSRSRRRGRKK